MTDFDDLYGGRFLSSQEVKAPTNVTIERIERRRSPARASRRAQKLVLYFKGGKKGMVINKTNANALAAAFGKNLSDWVGKRMTIKSEPTIFGGKPTQGLRLYPVTDTGGARAPAGTRAEAAPGKDDMDDEIPW